MQKLLRRIVLLSYEKIFGEKPGPAVVNFIKKLGYVGFCFIAAAVLLTTFQIYVGREIGPHGYGTLSLIRALASFLALPLMMGNIGIAKYLSETSDDVERKKILSASTLITVVAAAVFLPSYLLISHQILGVVSVDAKFVLFALTLSVAALFLDYARRILQGLNDMKNVGLMEFSRSIITFAVVAVAFLLLGDASVEAAIISLVAGFAISSLISLPTLKKYFDYRLCLDRIWYPRLLNFSLYSLAGSMSFLVLAYMDRIFLAVLRGLSDVGVYQAYSYSTLGVSAYFTVIFTTVFLPESSRGPKEFVWNKMKKGLTVAPLFYFLTLGSCVVFLMLYGSEYPVKSSYLLLFPILPAIHFTYTVYSMFSISLGVAGIRNSSLCIISAAVLNTVFNLLLIPAHGVIGALLATVLSYVLVLPYLISKSRKIMVSSR